MAEHVLPADIERTSMAIITRLSVRRSGCPSALGTLQAARNNSLPPEKNSDSRPGKNRIWHSIKSPFFDREIRKTDFVYRLHTPSMVCFSGCLIARTCTRVCARRSRREWISRRSDAKRRFPIRFLEAHQHKPIADQQRTLHQHPVRGQ